MGTSRWPTPTGTGQVKVPLAFPLVGSGEKGTQTIA